MSLAFFGLTAPASPQALKAAYRRLAQEAHPDRGGSDAAFQALQAAFQVALQELAQGAGALPLDALAPAPCPTCRGTGKVVINQGFSSLSWPCAACDGTGEAPQEQA